MRFFIVSFVIAAAPVSVSAQAAPQPAGTEPDRPSAREVEREIRDVRSWMEDTYNTARRRMRGYRKPPCDETAGEDCFQGDRECPLSCLWPEDRSTLRRLGERYDEKAALVSAAEPGAAAWLLNWLAGQRVGLWARMGELERARVAADECRAAEWWCVALRGFVDQMSGDAASAEARFERVLRMMPPNHACYWNEIALFSDTTVLSVGHRGDGRHLREPREWGGVRCPDRNDVAAFWTLADPLWTRPGNDRMAAHYARHVDLEIHRQHKEVFFPRTGFPPDTVPFHMLDHHTKVVRYGWPTGIDWEIEGPDLVYGNVGQSFVVNLPRDEALSAPAHVFDPPAQRVRETFLPSYGPVLPMPLQYGFFRRAEAPIMVMRAAVPQTEGSSTEGSSTATWKLASWDGTSWRTALVDVRADTITAWLLTPWQPQIVSLEAEHENGAWRARTGTAPPALSSVILADGTAPQATDSAAYVVPPAAMSSVVLLDANGDQPSDLAAAARAMLPSAAVDSGSTAFAYWELYTDNPVNAYIEVVVRAVDDRSFLSRIVGSAPPPALQVRWEELIEPTGGVARRSVDFGADRLAPGDYALQVMLVLQSGVVHTATTPLMIR